MERFELINALGQLVGAESYLEIGVQSGNTFREVRIRDKFGVDPDLKADLGSLGGAFSSTTSDVFFASGLGKVREFDLIFIDGLHTFEQSLKDLLNSVNRLSKKGVIVIDDVLPSDHIAALRDHRRSRLLKERLGAVDRDWMGDVFKTVAFLHDYLADYSYSTINTRHAMCVVWQDVPRVLEPLVSTMTEIAGMTYADLLERPEVLNRKAPEEIFALIEGRAE